VIEDRLRRDREENERLIRDVEEWLQQRDQQKGAIRHM